MKCLVGGRVILPEQILEGKAVIYDEKIIDIIDAADVAKYPQAEVIDVNGLYIAPGLIDVHSHGCVGEDATTSDAEGVRKMCRSVVGDGVTSWLPTVMTYPVDSLSASFEMFRGLMKESTSHRNEWKGAEILGVNMEGPYINVSKKGAHVAEFIQLPDAAYVKQYQDVIRLLTIAPEVEGGMDFVREIARDTDIRQAIGHTACGYDETIAAFDAGITEVTHLFNAMNGIHHRNPGVVGAALTRKDVYCELIADTFHIHKGLFQLVADTKKDHLVLITDSMRAAGLPDGEYDLGGQQVKVEGIRCLLPDGTIAGSVSRLNQAVRNLYQNTDLTFYEAVNAASLNPARAIGVDAVKGSIAVGKDADFVVMDENCNIYKTYVGGELCYEK